MVHLIVAGLAATAALSLTSLVQAAPTRDDVLRALARRDATYEDCEGAQRTKAGQAVADAAVLARWARDRIESYQTTDAFTHYFDGDDIDTVSRMFSGISQNGDPTNPPFRFIVTCKNSNDCDGGSLAVTDTGRRTDSFTPRMRLCPKFFDSNTDETKNDLGSKEIKKNPGRRDNSWCQPGQKFSFFEVAATTILHEMTHLFDVADYARLSDGTEDVYTLNDENYNYSNIPHIASRQLKSYWSNKKDGKDPVARRVENAESYAASATEFYFQNRCGFDTILE